MKAPYGLSDATEYGIEYVVVVDGKPPKKVTVWNGIERDWTERSIHSLRGRPRQLVGNHLWATFYRPRLVTRGNHKMVAVHQLGNAIWNATDSFGKAWLSESRMTSMYNRPPGFYRATRTERYAISIDFDTWSNYGTAEGDAWWESFIASRLTLYDLTFDGPTQPSLL